MMEILCFCKKLCVAKFAGKRRQAFNQRFLKRLQLQSGSADHDERRSDEVTEHNQKARKIISADVIFLNYMIIGHHKTDAAYCHQHG